MDVSLLNCLILTALMFSRYLSEGLNNTCYVKAPGNNNACEKNIMFLCQLDMVINLESIMIYWCKGSSSCTCSSPGDSQKCFLNASSSDTIAESVNSCNNITSCNISNPICDSTDCLVLDVNYTCSQLSEASSSTTSSLTTVFDSSSLNPSSSSLSSSSSSITQSFTGPTSSSNVTYDLTTESGTHFQAPGGPFPTSIFVVVLVFIFLSIAGAITVFICVKKKKMGSKFIQDRKVKLHIVVNDGYMDHQVEAIPDTQPQVVDTGNVYLELSEVDGPESTTNVSDDVEYNVLNLKTLPVKADLTYGHLASVGDDVNNQYSHVTRHQTSGAANDKYAQSVDIDGTYAHTGVPGDTLANSVAADDTYAHTDSPKTEAVDDSTYNTLRY